MWVGAEQIGKIVEQGQARLDAAGMSQIGCGTGSLPSGDNASEIQRFSPL